MSDANLRHWQALCETDPKATKPFDKGRFKGTSTNPVWREWLLTEHFGPCGIGWGMDKPEFTLVPAGDELLVFCTVTLWYHDGVGDEPVGAEARVYGVGGDKVIRIEKGGPFVSDEAYKAAFTDALGNAMKHLGISADIYSGGFDADKHTRPTSTATRETPRDKGVRIYRAMQKATTEKLINDIQLVNQAELVFLKGADPEIHATLIAYAEQRKAELAQPNGSELAEGLREALGQP
jgi:hypothetical protein